MFGKMLCGSIVTAVLVLTGAEPAGAAPEPAADRSVRSWPAPAAGLGIES